MLCVFFIYNLKYKLETCLSTWLENLSGSLFLLTGTTGVGD